MADPGVCYCGAYGGGKHTKTARCDGSREPSTRTDERCVVCGGRTVSTVGSLINGAWHCYNCAEGLRQVPVSSNQRLYALKQRPRVATHITQELIEAHILDGAPLPEGLRIGGCTFHKVDRWVRSVSMFCKSKSTTSLPVSIGEWLLAPDERGNCDTVQNWVFERDWEPYSAVETAAEPVTAEMFKSRLFQQFMAQGFWHAHHVDLVWRYNGEDVREEADWLKDIWYALRGKRFRSSSPLADAIESLRGAGPPPTEPVRFAAETAGKPFAGLLSWGLRPVLPHCELSIRFESVEAAQEAREAIRGFISMQSSEKSTAPLTISKPPQNIPASASTDDGAPPSRSPTSSVECPKCRTQLAFEGDECGLCNPDFAEVGP